MSEWKEIVMECKNCGKSIKDDTFKCPYCNKVNSIPNWLIVSLVIFGAFILILLVCSGEGDNYTSIFNNISHKKRIIFYYHSLVYKPFCSVP